MKNSSTLVNKESIIVLISLAMSFISFRVIAETKNVDCASPSGQGICSIDYTEQLKAAEAAVKNKPKK